MSVRAIDASQEFDAASELLGAGDYSAAIRAYDAIMDEHGEVAAAYLGRGRARVATGDIDGGLADLNHAHDIDPELAGLAQEIADIHYSQASYDQALGFYESAAARGSLGCSLPYCTRV